MDRRSVLKGAVAAGVVLVATPALAISPPSAYAIIQSRKEQIAQALMYEPNETKTVVRIVRHHLPELRWMKDYVVWHHKGMNGTDCTVNIYVKKPTGIYAIFSIHMMTTAVKFEELAEMDTNAP